MNREIKFRAESIHDSVFLYGYYFSQHYGEGGRKHFIVHYAGADEVIPETVGQYTGLKDKNGTEIYEGDKVFNKSWNPDTMEVRFYDGAFMLYFEGCEPYFVDGYYAEEFEVIGNIHENPEILN